MKDWSKKLDCAICGSIMIEEDSKYFNRFIFVTPDGLYTYDKIHLFSYSNENKFYQKGNSKTLINWRDLIFYL
jgi:predicted amidohydrolase